MNKHIELPATSQQIVMMAAAILGQPEGTANNRHPEWPIAVAQAERAYAALFAIAAHEQARVVGEPVATGPLSYVCVNGCGYCGVRLSDFVTHQTMDQDSDVWKVVASEPQIVSTCCGSAVEVWDERKQDVTGKVEIASPPAPQEAQAALPNGWVPCELSFDGGESEEVAYGPPIMMDRLGQWLTKYFASRLAAPVAQPAKSLEQQLRDALEAMGSKRAQMLSAGDLMAVVCDVDAVAQPATEQAEAPSDTLRIACITLDGSTLYIPAKCITNFGIGEDDGETYALTFKTMTRAEFDALGEFDGF